MEDVPIDARVHAPPLYVDETEEQPTTDSALRANVERGPTGITIRIWKHKSWALIFLVTVLTLTWTSPVFAQDGPPSLAQPLLTPGTLLVLLLSALGGYLSHAVQTGSLFGSVTVPKPWLPYVTIAGTFLLAFAASLQTAGGISKLSLLNAATMGVLALLGNTAGVTARQQVAAHLRDMTPPR